MIEFEVFHQGRTMRLAFEHSLRALSKWESIHRVPFLANREKTPSELHSYFECMLVSPDVDTSLVALLKPAQMDRLAKYINENQSASSVPSDGPPQYNPEITTSELVYFWMTALRIDWQAQDWHFSRLMMLIQITSYKQQPPKKRNPVEVMRDMRAENERRKKMLGTSG